MMLARRVFLRRLGVVLVAPGVLWSHRPGHGSGTSTVLDHNNQAILDHNNQAIEG
jgi:hypothetical protein